MIESCELFHSPGVPSLTLARRRLTVHDETFARLTRSRDFMAAHLDQRVKLADAARVACLSPFHYQRMFVRAFSETPAEFIRRLRLERAKQLLANDDLPVTEICFEVGYASLGTFSTAFTAAIGYTPSEYRRAVRRVFACVYPVPYRFVPSCFLRWWQTSEWPGNQNSKIEEAAASALVRP